MSLLTLLLFFLYTWGLGFSATYYLKKPENFLERHIVNIALGLGIFPLLSVLFNLVHIPLDWKIFFVVSMVFPSYVFVQNVLKKKFTLPSLKITKSDLALFAVILLVFASLFMYTKGAFSYPYLENEDPWGHSVGVKYVALEKTAYDPDVYREGWNIDQKLSYIDPYPPAYDVLLGVLHQTSPDLRWTMKFFNALLISLGILFFFLVAKKFIGDRNKALFATFVLAAIPSYLSHFIWAHALVVTIFFPAVYALEMMKEDKRWGIIAAIIVGSIWVSQNISKPLQLTTMILIYLVVSSIASRKFLKHGFAALAGGIVLSFSWWGAMIAKHGFKEFMIYYTGDQLVDTASSAAAGVVSSSGVGFFSLLVSKVTILIGFATRAGGSGARAYSFDDFFIAQGQNMINNPIGIGVVLTIVTLIGVVYILVKHKSRLVTVENTWLCISMFWLIFTFWGVNGQTFPISVARGPFRIWMLLAIPVALIATEGVWFLKDFFSRWKVPKALVVGVIIIGILLTSAYQKYELNTAMWPTSGSFTTPSEPFEYGAWFDTLPPNINVFLYSPRDKLAIGYGAFSCDWCQNVIDFRQDILDHDAEALHSFLKSNNYRYLLINGRMDFKYFTSSFGENQTRTLLPQRYDEILNSGLFVPVHQVDNSFIVFEVK